MIIRKACEPDLPAVFAIYARARAFMRENGNPNQWGNGKPNENTVRKDVRSGDLYAVCDADGICGVFFFKIFDDPTYRVIENGKWLNNEKYGVIHRIASSGTKKGVLRTAVDYCFSVIPNIRIDTHEDNKIMQSALEKIGFLPCGTIHTDDGSPRIAYQKTK